MSDYISREAAIGRAVEIPLFGKMVKAVAVSELERLPAADVRPKWISVEDKLPEYGSTVLVTDGVGVDMAVYNDIGPDWDGGVFVDCGSTVPLINSDYVTHWMPLPEPPKEGEA